MAFQVELSQQAEADIAEAADYIAADSPDNARKWVDALLVQLETLREMPQRHDLIPEAKLLLRHLRSIQHYSHRIIYEVNEDNLRVSIVRVYHGARKPLRRKDLL